MYAVAWERSSVPSLCLVASCLCLFALSIGRALPSLRLPLVQCSYNEEIVLFFVFFLFFSTEVVVCAFALLVRITRRVADFRSRLLRPLSASKNFLHKHASPLSVRGVRCYLVRRQPRTPRLLIPWRCPRPAQSRDAKSLP